MGAKGQRERPSEQKRASCKANARRPRGAWAGTPEREQLEEVKASLRDALPDGATRLAELIRDPGTPAELFLAAFKVAADRAGLSVLTQSEVSLSQPQIGGVQIIVAAGTPAADLEP